MTLVDLYAVLGVVRSIADDRVAEAYRSAARQAHPDTGGSHEAFLQVDLARRVLGDPTARRRYDALLALQDALDNPRTTPEVVRSALRAAIGELWGWRVPVELDGAVQLLVAEAERRSAETTAASSAHTQGPSWGTTNSGARGGAQPPPSDPDIDEMLRKWRTRNLEWAARTAMRTMTDAWPKYRDGIKRARPKERLGSIQYSGGIAAYRSMCTVADTLRTSGSLSAEQARLHVHVCLVLFDMNSFLREQGARLGRGDQLRSEARLHRELERACKDLSRRNLVLGDPPWGRANSGDDGQDVAPAAEARTAADGAKRSRAEPKRRLAWIGGVAAGGLLVAVDVANGAGGLRIIGGVIALVALVWLLASNPDVVRLVGRAVLLVLRVTWWIVVGLFKVIGALLSIVTKR